jgi:hypothetical protein
MSCLPLVQWTGAHGVRLVLAPGLRRLLADGARPMRRVRDELGDVHALQGCVRTRLRGLCATLVPRMLWIGA